MLYALRIHDSPPSELPEKSVRMSGKATLTIVASRKASPAPKDATASTAAGRADVRRRGGEAVAVVMPNHRPAWRRRVHRASPLFRTADLGGDPAR